MIFGEGVVGSGKAGACYDGIVLKSNSANSCTVMCEPGYNNNAGEVATVKCATDAAQGDATTGQPY